MVHVTCTRIIEICIDGMSIGNNKGVIIKGIDPLKFIPLHLGDLEISKELEGWIRSWWGMDIETLIPEGWFTRGKVS